MRRETPRARFTDDEAAKIAATLGIDFQAEAFDLAQFTRGLLVELEHGSRDPETDVTHDDPVQTGKIAWAHLKEMPDYYERLEEMERHAPREPVPGSAHPWLDFEDQRDRADEL